MPVGNKIVDDHRQMATDLMRVSGVEPPVRAGAAMTPGRLRLAQLTAIWSGGEPVLSDTLITDDVCKPKTRLRHAGHVDRGIAQLVHDDDVVAAGLDAPEQMPDNEMRIQTA